ncbi:MAG: hypothetical protein JSR54_15790 [Proteobacteria bacterium]|nr:hypothetical protein [Pseudomonadota bacterium]
MIRIPTLAASLAAVLALGAATAAQAACTYPPAPSSIPDGRTASYEDMVEANKAVKQFILDVDAYLKCVDDENPAPAAGTKLSDEQKKAVDAAERLRVQKHNAAVADEESVRDRFNEQLKAYKEAHPKK